MVDWNEDGRKDLVVGERYGKFWIYLNEGTDTEPDFLERLAVQDTAGTLVVPSYRSSPHVLDFDHDGRKDIVTGNTNGELLLYLNVGTDDAPVFAGYTPVEADGAPIDLSGASRSRPFVCEWNRDGFRDVLIGYGDGLVRIYTGIEHYHTDVPTTDLAAAAALLAPRPNPALTRSELTMVLPSEEAVRLAVYDVSGRLVSTLADRTFAPGRHELAWAGTDARGRRLPSGVYFVRMETPAAVRTRRLVLLR